MSPDDHYADLKRLISATGGKTERITVIMPTLYGGRQHKRNSRESLDCAQMLQELFAMGVKDLICFDAHDPRVQNAVPLMGFDNFFPTYQILKALLERFPDVKLTQDNFMIVSPDEGAMNRNIFYASVLGVELGMFYKRRDYANVVNGRNKIVAHEYIGIDVKDKDIFVADDIIATGDSVLRLCHDLKEKGAKRIFLMATYALFTEGVERFDDAYAEGLFTAVISTNLTYIKEELACREWFVCADISKYIAYIIASCNQNKSVSPLLNSADRIHELIGKN
jgi:ribose-phosphate pyrophosphokinase